MDATSTFRRRIVALLLVGFALLLMEIRFEHREVLAERWESYFPLIYTGALLLVGIPGLLAWERWGRLLLLAGFALALVVGVLGLWFHSDGHPVAGIRRVLTAWSLRPGDNGGVKPENSGPPVMAPLSFLGLGTIGILACGRRGSRVS